MAQATAYDPSDLTVVSEYVTTASDVRAFISAYNQDLTDLSPVGVTVQAGGTPWPAPEV